MNEVILRLMEPTVIILALVMSAIFILGAIYDLLNKRRELARAVNLKRINSSNQPTVTIIIDSTVQAGFIEECLSRINRSHYRFIDIVVATDSSTRFGNKQTSKLIRSSSYPLRVYQMRSLKSHEEMLRRSYQRSRRGEIVVVLRPDMRISPLFIKGAVASMSTMTRLSAIQLSYRETQELRIETVVKHFVAGSDLICQKARQMIGFRTVGLRSGYIYLAESLKPKSRRVPVFFDSKLVVGTTQVASSGWRKRLLLASLSLIFMVVSLVAISAILNRVTKTPFLLLYLMCCFWLVGVIVFDERHKLKFRIKLALAVPSGYFMLLATAILYIPKILYAMVQRQLPD